MRSMQSNVLRILSLCLLLCLLVSTVSASSPGLGPITDSDEAVLLPDPYEMSLISAGFKVAYLSYYSGDTHSTKPDYFAGFYKNADGTMVMCLTEISEEILAEIRTAIYSYNDGANTEFLDQWFPTMSYQQVTYSSAQLQKLKAELETTLAAANCGDYQTRIDFRENQVVVFCETKEGLKLAAEAEVAGTDMLLVLPMEQFETWLTYATRDTIHHRRETITQDIPEEPDATALLWPTQPKHNLRHRPY